MARLTVEKNGHFQCTGNGYCGGTDYDGRKRILECFHCESCLSYQREGLKITDLRVGLGQFLGGEKE